MTQVSDLQSDAAGSGTDDVVDHAACTQCSPNGRASVKLNPMTCSIENCAKPAIAKGLCRMHYARLRRTGHPTKRGKPGCPRDESKALVLDLFKDWSPRTQQRYWMAFKRLRVLCELQHVAMNAANSPYREVLKICTRPNGSVNVNQLSRMAVSMCVRHLAGMEDTT
jgi:hypothetical protein